MFIVMCCNILLDLNYCEYIHIQSIKESIILCSMAMVVRKCRTCIATQQRDMSISLFTGGPSKQLTCMVS